MRKLKGGRSNWSKTRKRSIMYMNKPDGFMEGTLRLIRGAFCLKARGSFD